MERVFRAFSYRVAEKLAEVFSKHEVEYLFIGKSGAILYGFPDTTQDVDIFPEKSRENGRKIVQALKEIGFEIDETLQKAIVDGKDFIQIRGGPLDIDLVFAPDGIESFKEAKLRYNLIGGKFAVAALRDIIASKEAAGRQRDKEVLPRLKSFAKFMEAHKK
ncbi:MAG: hypothetical protein ACE5OR_05900 [bacterium]